MRFNSITEAIRDLEEIHEDSHISISFFSDISGQFTNDNGDPIEEFDNEEELAEVITKIRIKLQLYRRAKKRGNPESN